MLGLTQRGHWSSLGVELEVSGLGDMKEGVWQED